MRSPRLIVATLALSLSFAVPVVHADDHPMLDTFSVSAGFFANNFDGGLRADGQVKNSGTTLNFSRDLGQDDSRYLPYFAVSWRPWDRHEFEFSYYHDSTDGNRTLTRNLQFNNQELVVGSTLRSKFTLDTFGFTYRYWAWIGDEAAFALTGGLQAYSFDLKLDGTVSANGPGGGGTATRQAKAKANTDLPDPSIGVAFRYQMASWARLTADLGAFKANIADIDATLYNARVGVEFYPFENWAVITQYSYNKIDADVNKDRFRGNATFRFSGGQVLLKYRF
ncbi:MULTISPECIES: hypothetical protein [Dyella]|uniref:Outer membrane protein beta-barrel domain-containing protein n=2 Tax=Dyella TaxID=231454 RepID=A0A4R0YXM0_9GAMM|nr:MULTISPECIES: hypothetical protein [Dyella]TBR40299.1 hypothetical protein EYV96_09100 [Dyella terrae]TCI12119.1 hypothetical protein EZM97_01770 [Dyella soli]